jgi:hypothetical protein
MKESLTPVLYVFCLASQQCKLYLITKIAEQYEASLRKTLRSKREGIIR